MKFQKNFYFLAITLLSGCNLGNSTKSPDTRPEEQKAGNNSKEKIGTDSAGAPNASDLNILKRIEKVNILPDSCSESGVLFYEPKSCESRFCYENKIILPQFDLQHCGARAMLALLANPVHTKEFNLVYVAFFKDPSASKDYGTACNQVLNNEVVGKMWGGVWKGLEVIGCPAPLESYFKVGEDFPPVELITKDGKIRLVALER